MEFFHFVDGGDRRGDVARLSGTPKWNVFRAMIWWAVQAWKSWGSINTSVCSWIVDPLEPRVCMLIGEADKKWPMDRIKRYVVHFSNYLKNLHPDKKSHGLRYGRKSSRQLLYPLGCSAFIYKNRNTDKNIYWAAIYGHMPKTVWGALIMVIEFPQVQYLRERRLSVMP